MTTWFRSDALPAIWVRFSNGEASDSSWGCRQQSSLSEPSHPTPQSRGSPTPERGTGNSSSRSIRARLP